MNKANVLNSSAYVNRGALAGRNVGYAVRLVLAGALAAAAASAVHAQETGDSEELDVLDEIVVTGTSIRREDDAALPVTVVSAEEMESRDAGSPVDLLTSLPAVANVPLNESAQGGAGARGDVAAISLRGLGSGSTLLLLNGRRMASHGIAANEVGVPTLSVNANIMPARGLSRVDVLRDGASSIYGSDAVAGVINFVVDTRFTGTEIEVQAGMNEIASGDDRRVTLTHGGFYGGERLHWVSTFDYFDRDETQSADVAGDSNKVPLAPPGFNALTGPFFDRNASSAYPSFRIGSATATRYLAPTATGAAFSTTVPPRNGEFASQFYYDMNTGYALPQSTRFNWFNQLDLQVNESFSLFTELALYKAESNMVRPPVAYGASSDQLIVLGVNNPWNPYGSRFYHPTGAPNTDGSARATGTPQSVNLQSYRFVDNGNEQVEIDTDAYRLVVGGRGNISENWTWESAATVSRAKTTDISRNAVRESALQSAIAAGSYNPWGYNFAVVGNAVVPTTAYANDPAVIDSFSQDFIQSGRNVLATVDARVTGPIYDIWAGSIQASLGVEHRWDDYKLTRPQYHGLNYENDLGLPPGGNDFVQASPVGDIIGDRKVAAAFVETVIPLVSEMNGVPLVQSLSVGASMRYEDYSDFGSTANPKFTVDYRPVSAVMIRGSYNKGFRAPSLAASNYPSRSAVGSYNDPYRQAVTGLPSDGQFQRLTTTSGNPDLDPETSKGWTAGIVVDVPFVTGLRFSVDYFKIEQEALIAAPNASQLRDNDAALLRAATQAALAAGTAYASIDLGSGTSGYQGNSLIRRGAVTADDIAFFNAYNSSRPQSEWVAPVGALIETSTPFSNLDSAQISGYDFNISYTLPATPYGKFGFSTDWALIDNYERLGGYTGDSTTQLGIDGTSELRGSANLNWSMNNWTAGVSAYYIGDYADTAASITEAVYQTLDDPDYVKTVDGIRYWKVEDSVTFNAFASATFISDTHWLSGITTRIGVRNFTNKKPSLTSAVAGYDASVYNSVASGRAWTLRLSKSF